MRIAQVSLDGNLPRFGVGLAVVRLSEALGRRGHDVRLLVREVNAARVVPRSGVSVAGLRHRRGLLGGRRGYVAQVRAAAGPGLDVVHVHGLARMAHWLLPPRARDGAPLVVTAHAAEEVGPAASPAGDAPERRARRHVRQVREVLAGADAVLAPSRWMASLLAAVVQRPVDVVGHAPSEDVPAERAPHEGFRVLALGRLVPAKGMDVLVEAFRRAFGTDPRARLVIAGEGPERGPLEEQARAAGLLAQVAFAGYVEGEERRRRLATADVLVMPTRGGYETFGIAALDASAAGIPLVVADSGALPERAAGGAGVVVPSGDPEALAEALRLLAGDANRARTMGGIGAALARAWTWDDVAAAHERVYARVLAARTNGPPLPD